jgi:hypothetical protein
VRDEHHAEREAQHECADLLGLGHGLSPVVSEAECPPECPARFCA